LYTDSCEDSRYILIGGTGGVKAGKKRKIINSVNSLKIDGLGIWTLVLGRNARSRMMQEAPSRLEMKKRLMTLDRGNINKLRGYIDCLNDNRARNAELGKRPKPLLLNRKAFE
jgi:hypothetical protein